MDKAPEYGLDKKGMNSVNLFLTQKWQAAKFINNLSSLFSLLSFAGFSTMIIGHRVLDR